MSYIDNGVIRLGVNLDIGGAITYIADSKEKINVVNSHDWGRQIQMSFYSGPVPYIEDGKRPKKHWERLGWNPIQSGDCFGNRSRTVEHRNEGKSLYVKCIPMQWPMDNVPGECTYESWLELDGNTVMARCRLVNRRADKTQYRGRNQELPAVYTNGPYYRLMTYAGDKPFTGGELAWIEKKAKKAEFPWSRWNATENWAALVGDDGWGLGVWTPGTCNYLGGFAGRPGRGGPRDGPTGYIAPLATDILDHNIIYDYSYVLILGTLEGIRRHVYANSRRRTPPRWVFEKDRQGWYYVDARDAGWPVEGELDIRLEGRDPQLIGPVGFWRAEDAPKLVIDAAFRTGDARAQVMWQRHGDKGFARGNALDFEVRPDGRRREYEVDLSSSPRYRGAITRLRIDPAPSARKGDRVRLRSISLGRR
ncbi:MAG: hypothetical protein ACYTKD_00690 [Planctomycetota bacterium]|jgi:hypothetical protein